MSMQEPAAPQQKPVDAAVRVIVSKDGMSAAVELEPPRFGGAAATGEAIAAALAASGVTHGLDEKALVLLRVCPQYDSPVFVAKGTPPVSGVDGSVSFLFDTSRETKPRERSDGTVDYRDLGLVQNVKKGQALAKITPPSQGRKGVTVRGKPILPVQGKTAPSPEGRNTRLSEDGAELLALIDGHVELAGSRVNVTDTFSVPHDVDTSTGNIVSVANVTVCGSVREGFAVKAGGNVEVGGAVEAGSVSAEGAVGIHGGVVGRGRAQIACGGDFSTSFLENCEVTAGGLVRAESVLNSVVKCGRLELAGRAMLMGGRVMARDGVAARQLGSPAMLPTEISVGIDPAVLTRHAALKAELEQLTGNIEKLRQIVGLLGEHEKAGTLPPPKLRLLLNSRLSLRAMLEKYGKGRQEFALLAKELENVGKGTVVCRGPVCRGVKITIGFASLTVERDMPATVFSFAEGKIVTAPAAAF